MIKKIILFCLSFSTLFGIAYFLHDYILAENSLRFELLHLYIFHFIFSLLICCLFQVLSNSQKWSHQLGFIYIFALVTKLLFFGLVFKDSVFKIESLTKTESFNLLIPMFLFLFLEVYFITKILKTK